MHSKNGAETAATNIDAYDSFRQGFSSLLFNMAIITARINVYDCQGSSDQVVIVNTDESS